MKKTKIIMGMPIIVEIADKNVNGLIFKKVFEYFQKIDEKFSTYKKDSEISKLNHGVIKASEISQDLAHILKLCEKTKLETGGYFDIFQFGRLDPSGIVKGWAILEASKILKKEGFSNFYINAGGDIEASGTNHGKAWTVGIRHPFQKQKVTGVLKIKNAGVATSGDYERGNHIYNPLGRVNREIVSITVIGPNIYEADRFATAAYAMGRAGIEFIAKQKNLEGYMIDNAGRATYTSGFARYVQN